MTESMKLGTNEMNETVSSVVEISFREFLTSDEILEMEKETPRFVAELLAQPESLDQWLQTIVRNPQSHATRDKILGLAKEPKNEQTPARRSKISFFFRPVKNALALTKKSLEQERKEILTRAQADKVTTDELMIEILTARDGAIALGAALEDVRNYVETDKLENADTLIEQVNTALREVISFFLLETVMFTSVRTVSNSCEAIISHLSRTVQD